MKTVHSNSKMIRQLAGAALHGLAALALVVALAVHAHAAPTATSVVLTSSLTPAALGVSVTFTATIPPSVPDGEVVTFNDGTTSLGTGKTSASVATLTVSSLIVGSHGITASYGGNADFAASSSNTVTQVVMSATTTTLASSLSPSLYGASVLFTATIAPAVPDGETVTFYDGATSIGNRKTSGAAATFATTTLTGGSHNITAAYAGDANNGASTSKTVVQVIDQVMTTVSLASSLNPSTFVAPVKLTATISPSVPDGETVTFLDGPGLVGMSTTNGSVATFTTSSLVAGAHGITAAYPGDANYAASTSSMLSQTVNVAATTLSLASSVNPAAFGAPVTFTATISPSVPNGELVTFYHAGTVIGTGKSTSSTASLSTIYSLNLGAHPISAAYQGNANCAACSSNVLTQVVTMSSMTMLSSQLNPSTVGASVTFTAMILPGVPNGEKVTFYDGGSLIGTALTSGSLATLSNTTLAIGSHIITAAYAGDTAISPSTSGALTQVVGQVPTIVALSSSANSVPAGATVTFTATVMPAVPNGGTVTFYDAGTQIGTSTTDRAAATYSTNKLANGHHSITATYGGDTNNASSTSRPLIQAVGE